MKLTPLQPHYVMIIAENFQANMNQMVFDVINYNLDNFADKNYRTEGTVVDTGYILITTGPFENAGEAGVWLSTFNPRKLSGGLTMQLCHCISSAATTW